MQEKEFLSLLSDTTFKYLFKSDYGRIYLNIILQYITSINIENYILIDNELNSGTNNKDYKTDILLYNEKDKIIINIEMNQFPSDITIYRNYSYISRIVSDLFHKGDKIEKYKVIQVNFNNSYYKYDNRINNLSFVLRDKNYGYELDIVKIIEVYIPTYKGICYNGKNREEMFLSMFNAKSYKELKNIVLNNEEGLKIMEELEYLAAKEGIIGLYNFEKEQKRMMASIKEESYEDGYLEGVSQGISQGISQGKEETIKDFIKAGIKAEKIAAATGLTIERINELKKKI